MIAFRNCSHILPQYCPNEPLRNRLYRLEIVHEKCLTHASTHEWLALRHLNNLVDLHWVLVEKLVVAHQFYLFCNLKELSATTAAARNHTTYQHMTNNLSDILLAKSVRNLYYVRSTVQI